MPSMPSTWADCGPWRIACPLTRTSMGPPSCRPICSRGMLREMTAWKDRAGAGVWRAMSVPMSLRPVKGEDVLVLPGVLVALAVVREAANARAAADGRVDEGHERPVLLQAGLAGVGVVGVGHVEDLHDFARLGVAG